MLAAVLWPTLTGLALLSETAIHTLYGPNWVAAALPLSLLAISFMLYLPLIMTTEIFIVCHETRRQLRLESIRSVVAITLFGVGCLFGLAWAAAAKIAENLFALMLFRADIERLTDTSIQDLVPIYAEGAVLSLAATLPTLALILDLDLAGPLPLPAVFTAIGMGGVLWLLTLRALKHPLFAEGMRLLKRKQPTQVPG
jgi:O-antigen/teichoic acid export membrane protein